MIVLRKLFSDRGIVEKAVGRVIKKRYIAGAGLLALGGRSTYNTYETFTGNINKAI